MSDNTADNAALERIVPRMQDPSWLILRALHPTQARAGIEIIRRVEDFYRASGYPQRTLDPSTFHHGMKRMGDDGLVECVGKQEVDVPGPWKTTQRQMRSVFVITGLGMRALQLRARLEAVASASSYEWYPRTGATHA